MINKTQLNNIISEKRRFCVEPEIVNRAKQKKRKMPQSVNIICKSNIEFLKKIRDEAVQDVKSFVIDDDDVIACENSRIDSLVRYEIQKWEDKNDK